jgi:hypothetical protein
VSIPRQILGSLLLDGVSPGGQIQVLLANVATSAYTRTVRPPSKDHPARRREDSALAADRGPSGPRPRTARTVAKSIVVGTPRSDWRPDRCQHNVSTYELIVVLCYCY